MAILTQGIRRFRQSVQANVRVAP